LKKIYEERWIEVTRQEMKRQQLLDDFKEIRRYLKLKEKALNQTLWRTRFGRVCEPFIRQATNK
jgi:hypothetical protein